MHFCSPTELSLVGDNVHVRACMPQVFLKMGIEPVHIVSGKGLSFDVTWVFNNGLPGM